MTDTNTDFIVDCNYACSITFDFVKNDKEDDNDIKLEFTIYDDSDNRLTQYSATVNKTTFVSTLATAGAAYFELPTIFTFPAT